ncbi:MAG TPA: FAD-binding oxidoreductase [Gemmatimonadaceae bacterium]|jgi:glycolate oxidase FAD binding subunit
MSATANVAHARTTADVVAAVANAVARHSPVRIVGRGHWLDAGRPTRDASALLLDELSGVVAYTPGDLTLTARAGTTLADIAAVTADHAQWLALDPFGPLDGTLGATIATASAGPLAHAFGTPRDAALGIEAVTGDAAIIRAGGRVVKNVAGFDLTRLFTGAWGTLGVITEITVRLRARPQVDETWSIPVPANNGALEALCAALRAAPIAPLALELIDARLAAALSLGDHDVMLIRLGGSEESVRAQRDAIRTVGAAADAPAGVWDALRTSDPPGSAVVRFSDLPSRVADTWRAAREITSLAGGARQHASVGRGIVRVIAPPNDDAAVTALVHAAARAATAIPERLPGTCWSALTTPMPNAELARRVKRAFDPANLLNPGILGIEP